jgi:hypothetical protein
MSPRVRAVIGFKRFTDPQLVTTGRGVVKEMKDNPNFPNPPEELKTLESAVEELSAALAAQVQGGTAATAHKKNAFTLPDLSRKLQTRVLHPVYFSCNGNRNPLPRFSFWVASRSRSESGILVAALSLKTQSVCPTIA